MQATWNAIRLLRSSSSSFPISAHGGRRGGLLYATGSRAFAQHAAAASSALDKHEVTDRVLGLLRSIPFVDPAKVWSLPPSIPFSNLYLGRLPLIVCRSHMICDRDGVYCDIIGSCCFLFFLVSNLSCSIRTIAPRSDWRVLIPKSCCSEKHHISIFIFASCCSRSCRIFSLPNTLLETTAKNSEVERKVKHALS